MSKKEEISQATSLLCDCSFERVLNALRLIGLPELLAIEADGRQEVIHCGACGKEYILSVEALKALIQSMG